MRVNTSGSLRSPIGHGLVVATALALLIAVAVALLSYLSHAKFASLYEEIQRSSHQALALEVAGVAQRGLALGLPLRALDSLDEAARRALSGQDGAVAVRIVDDRGADVAGAGRPLSERTARAAADQLARLGLFGGGAMSGDLETGGERAILQPLTSSFGTAVGGVVVVYDGARVENDLLSTRSRQVQRGIAAVAVGTIAAFAISLGFGAWRRRRRHEPGERTPGRIGLKDGAALVVALVLTGLAFVTAQDFERALEPRLDQKVGVVASQIAAQVARAVDSGIPLDRIVGFDDLVEATRRDHPEIVGIAVVPASRSVDGEDATRVWRAIEVGGETIGAIEAQVVPGYIARRLGEIRGEVVVILLASFFLTLELVRAVSGADAGRAGAETTSSETSRPRGPEAVRLPLFLFFFATELSRSFLPMYARDLYDPNSWLRPDVAIAAPFTVYLFLVAVLTPVAGVFATRFGSRVVFLAGLVPTALGLAMSAEAQTVSELTAWRCVNALGFALVTIAALDHISRSTGLTRRAEGMALYTAAFVTAGLCGASVGGVLADRIGPQTTLLVAAALSLVAALVALLALPGRDHVGGGASRIPSLGDFGRVLRNRGFQVLVAFAAAPTQLLTTGYVFFAVPLLLDAAGYTTLVIGQVLVVYFVAIILVGVAAARRVDRSSAHVPVVAIGLVISGSSATIPFVVGSSDYLHAWVALSVGLVGLGQALCVPAQGALVLIAADREGADRRTTAISAYRVLERVGSVAGPLAAATLAIGLGYATAAAGLGVIVFSCALLFLVGARTDPRDEAMARTEPSA